MLQPVVIRMAFVIVVVSSSLTSSSSVSAFSFLLRHHLPRGSSLSHHPSNKKKNLLQMSSSSSTPPKNVVVIGGGIQGSSVAYHIANHESKPKVTILESKCLASAASGKGGGFMARSWGDGGPTERLHHLAFDLYPTLSTKLGCTSYRKLPVLSVSPGKNGQKSFRENPQLLPNWLDGNVGRVSVMGYGDDTAQITPLEFTTKLVEGCSSGGDEDEGDVVVLGTCTGIEFKEEDEGGNSRKKVVTGVKYKPRGEGEEADDEEEKVLPCDAVVISAGPWSCAAEDWFDGAVSLPMEGIKSTSIVWGTPPTKKKDDVDATALFCGEDDRFNTHLEVYPRPDGTIYLCGIGGSDYIPSSQLKSGAHREHCEANPSRVDAATASFREMSESYRETNGGQVAKIQACMRPCPPDALPYMGRIPGYDGAYINAGHNCWGIAWAPACGLAMSELVLEGESKSVNLTPFDPARFTPTNKSRGGRGRKKGTTSVGEQW